MNILNHWPKASTTRSPSCLLACLSGGFVPAGGASSIAAAMIPIIEEGGGAVVTSADVTNLLVTSGKAHGVRLATGQEITADTVGGVEGSGRRVLDCGWVLHQIKSCCTTLLDLITPLKYHNLFLFRLIIHIVLSSDILQ